MYVDLQTATALVMYLVYTEKVGSLVLGGVLGVKVLDADVLGFGPKLLVHLHLVHQRRKAAYLALATSIKADEQTECSCPSFSDLSSHEIPWQQGVFEQCWLKIWPKLCLS